MDELPVGSWLTEEKNSLAVVVAGYNADSFEYVNQPSFLTAELERGRRDCGRHRRRGGFPLP